MKTIVLIEEDQHYQNEVNAAVHELDHQNKFITFKNLKEFYSWFSKLLTNDNNQKEEKKDHIDLIIADFDSFKDVSLKLLVKTQKALVEKHLGDEEIPPSFIITTHETPEFHIESYLHSIIANILYKPFDRLILKESIHNALNGRKPIDSSLYRQKSNASIDMIKLVDITGLTELGFRTRATRPLAHGEIAKYYGEVFKDHKVDFTYAYCYNCSPHGEGYQCNFSYFGIGMEQISAMRRYIHSLKDRKPMILEDAKEVHPSENNVYIITQNIDDYKKISILISDNFSNVKCIPIFRFEYLIARLKDSSGTQKKTASNDKILKSENIHRLTLKKQKVIKFQEIDQKGEPKDLVQFGSLKIEDLKKNSAVDNFFQN